MLILVLYRIHLPLNTGKRKPFGKANETGFLQVLVRKGRRENAAAGGMLVAFACANDLPRFTILNPKCDKA